MAKTAEGEQARLRRFIRTYHCLPALWDVKTLDYNIKEKREKSYEILRDILRTLKPDATVHDVKRKINSMRSGFRKELRKVEVAASIGKIYRPSLWLYEDLMFLKDLETPQSRRKSTSFATSDDVDLTNSNDMPQHVDSDRQYPTPAKKPHHSERKQEEVLPRVCNSADAICDNELDTAKVWMGKLKSLDHMQRLLAEKAINDVLFEAQLGTLHRNSVKINENSDPPVTNSPVRRAYHQSFEPSQSSPEYKYNETEVLYVSD